MSSQPITDGLYVYDYLSYLHAARQKMSKETRQNVDRVGAKMEAVADGPQKAADTSIMRDLAAYRAEALKKVDPKTAARAKDALTLDAVEGLTENGRQVVIMLGREHLKKHDSRTDLDELMKGNNFGRALAGGVTLAADTTFEIGGVKYKFAKGSKLVFNQDGSIRIGVLAADTKVTIKGQEITFKKGSEISFYENGAVHTGYLAADTTINGYKLSSSFSVSFFDDGALESGGLAETVKFTIGGQEMSFAARTRIGLNPDGKLSEVWPAVEMDFTIGRITIKGKKDEEVSLHENGNVMFILPTEDTTFTVEGQKVKFAKERYLDFFSDGVFEEGVLAEDTTFTIAKKKIPLPKGVRITVDAYGKLEGVRFDEKTTILGKELEAGEYTIQQVMDVLFPPAVK